MDEKLISEQSKLETENRVLMLALRRAYEVLKSKEDYCRLLEENMTDEEYERASGEYDEYFYRTRQPRKQLSSEIAEEAKILLKVLESELGSDEIAEILNLDVIEVEKALQEHKPKQDCFLYVDKGGKKNAE